MIWRDDDIGVRTKIDDLRAVDDLFQKYRVRHTVAVMAAGMEKRPDLVDLIRERKMIPQLHCWEHVELNGDSLNDLPRAVDLMGELFGKRPTVLYPPWNQASDELVAIAMELGMTVSTRKISLQQYLRAGGDVHEDTINFHYWCVAEALQLEQALRIHEGY